MKNISQTPPGNLVEQLTTSTCLLRALGVAGGLALAASVMPTTAQAAAGDAKKPNILVIWGDDIDVWNVGA